MPANQFTFIDLFCGCGGFSLGLRQAGLKPIAAIDFNKEAIQVYKQNFPDVFAFETDITTYAPDALAQQLGISHVDVIVGGPPCQGFSTVRQRDGANSGPRMIEDKRRYLYQEFLRYVGYFKPAVFVMENVLGIKSAAGGRYFEQVQSEARALGYRVHPQVERAYELGVPQKRIRQLIIGTRGDIADYFPGKLKPCSKALINPTLGDAIDDLPPLDAGEGQEVMDYDLRLRGEYLKNYRGDYLFNTLEIIKSSKLTAHRARPHSLRDIRDFQKLREGENSAAAMKRGLEFEFPYDRNSFKDRYTRQSRSRPCSTIVAHLSKDGLMFVHPTQDRTLTPREAARVQSFPDTFQFPVARTHQFRVIGNAVPPLVAKAIGITISEFLDQQQCQKLNCDVLEIPATYEQAVDWLLPTLDFERRQLRAVELLSFKRMWAAVGFLFPGIHPDAALDHGNEIANHDSIPDFLDTRLASPYYVQSGWPVSLAKLAAEAWRRYEVGELADHEFYCSEACVAGIRFRAYRNEEKAVLGLDL